MKYISETTEQLKHMQYKYSFRMQPMNSLWFSIFLSLLICFTSVSMPINSVAHYGAGTDNTSHCKSVPYPFGAPGVALKGFEVTCTNTRGSLLYPSLLLPTGLYLIQSISLQGQVRIFTGPIYQQCIDIGTEMVPHGNGWLNLSGTPFTLSKDDTTFILIGCNDVAVINFFVEDINMDGEKFTSGCVAYCSNSSSRINGSCSGIGCCQMPLPGPAGLKSFELNLYKVQNTGVNGLGNCSAAFFATSDEFYFSTTYIDDAEFSIGSQTDHVIVLNWAIRHKSCEDAKKDLNSFACKENSHCYDSPNGAGYLCNCSRGYEGNPYVQGGCRDVDECQYTELNPCSRICINTEGSVTCACPLKMTGDGRKYGSGCKKALPLAYILGTIIPLGFGIISSIILLYFVIVKRIKLFEKRKQEKLKQKFFVQNRGLLLQQLIASHEDATQNMRILKLHELEKATNKFDNALIIGRGGHGEVYKGILLDQRVVAIKRSKIIDPAEIDQFINEVAILSQVNHRNIVKLYGCCLETEVPLLIYEFISNGTLFSHLHVEEHCSLTWKHRLRIALEAAGAISYLHSSASISVFHRDIKSSNILLDDYFTAKVSDFGASRSVQIDQTGVTTAIQGTHGYLDPEYYCTGRLTQKSDVYSFGVILAELLTREKPLFSSKKFEGGSLIAYFSSAMKENRLLEILDPQVVNEGHITELEAVAKISYMCLRMKGEERPTMKEVEVQLDVLWRSNKQEEHPWRSQRLEERQLILPDYIAGIDTTLQCRFEQELESLSFLSVNDPRSI